MSDKVREIKSMLADADTALVEAVSKRANLQRILDLQLVRCTLKDSLIAALEREIEKLKGGSNV